MVVGFAWSVTRLQKQINDIIIKEELYPREKISQDKVKEYEQYISVLPPVVINQDNVLIDGFHRFYAYKNTNQKQIEVIVNKTKDDDDLFLRAIELNSQHGLPLTNNEKKKLVVSMYQKIIDGNVSFDVRRLKTVFSIPDSTFSDWTKNLNEAIESQRLEKILDLYLKCMTQQEIADEIGLSQKQIGIKLKEIEEKIGELYQNPNSEICIIYQFLQTKLQEIYQFNPFLYNIWNVSSINNEYKHFGNFPIEFMENLFYYYTKPFDVVYDPFAGGGVTIDVCKKWMRKYYVSDREPIELRKDIYQWDIQQGLPNKLPKPDFVFLDPPYWQQAKNEYSQSPDDMGNMELGQYYDTINFLIKELKNKMDKGFIAFVISATQKPERIDHAIEINNIFIKNKFNLVERIILPYSTQQYNGNQVNVAKENKKMLNLFRDLMVYQK